LTKIHLQIHGKVQGVFYRQSARELAKLLGLDGWIKNNPDGTVELEARGAEQAVEQFLSWCQKGPPHAEVRQITVVSREVMEQAQARSDHRHFQIVG
jgi:acylphosphatase